MNPEGMLGYAEDLERAVSAGDWTESLAVNTEDYLEKAILFLRFWARHNFTVFPVTAPMASQVPVEYQEDNLPAEERMLH